jgi:Flp pilus assembly protein TadG
MRRFVLGRWTHKDARRACRSLWVMATPSQAWTDAARADEAAGGNVETNMANDRTQLSPDVSPRRLGKRVTRRLRYATRRRSERGIEIVEFALLSPLILSLIVGMFTGGLIYNTQLDMTHAAREGARYGAVLAKATSTSTGWATSVQNIVVQRSAGALNANQVCVSLVTGSPATVVPDPNSLDSTNQYTTNPDGASPCITNDGSSDTGWRVQVVIGSAPAQSKTAQLQAVFFNMNVNLTATALSKYES